MAEGPIEIIVSGAPLTLEIQAPANTPLFEVSTPQSSAPTYMRLTDFVSPYHYIGKALQGSAQDALVWQITRIEESADGTVISELVLLNVKWSERLIIDFE